MKIDDKADIAGMLQSALASLMPRLRGATADPRDELIVRYTRGKGRFSADKRFITLDMKMFTLDGKEDGIHQGVWEAQFTTPQDLLRAPSMPAGPMNVPVGPVPHIEPMSQTKSIWRFTDGSSITVVGPAVSHLIPLQDGSSIFMVSTAQRLAAGTGRYKGAVGVTQSLGTTFVPPGLNLFGTGTSYVDVSTLDTFKIVRQRYNRPFPEAGTVAPGPSSASSTASAAVPRVDQRETKQVQPRNAMMESIDEGVGDPVLFIHGNSSSSKTWSGIIPYVRPLARCLAPDLIASGQSMKPDTTSDVFARVNDLEEYIQKLGLDRITLVVHERGAALGLQYASQYPGKIKGIAFIGALESSSVADSSSGDSAGTKKDAAGYSEYLRTSSVPKLLFYAYSGAGRPQEQVEWCRKNLSHLETVNTGPDNTEAPTSLLQEKYPEKIGETIARWYRGLSQ